MVSPRRSAGSRVETPEAIGQATFIITGSLVLRASHFGERLAVVGVEGDELRQLPFVDPESQRPAGVSAEANSAGIDRLGAYELDRDAGTISAGVGAPPVLSLGRGRTPALPFPRCASRSGPEQPASRPQAPVGLTGRLNLARRLPTMA